MTWNDISQIVALFTGRELQPEEFSSMATGVNNSLFYQKWAEKDMDSLRKFRYTMGVNSAAMSVQNGIATVPSDFFMFESAYYYNGTSPAQIRFVGDHEFDRLLANAIEYPTAAYPIGNIQSDYIRIRPISVRLITFSYVRAPQPVEYAVTFTRGFAEWDEANSSEFMWNEADAVIIIQSLLNNLGINATQSEIKNKIEK